MARTTSITFQACLEAMERFHNDGPHTLYCEAGTVERVQELEEFSNGCLAGMKIVIDPGLPRGVWYIVSAKAKPPLVPDFDPLMRYLGRLRIRNKPMVKIEGA